MRGDIEAALWERVDGRIEVRFGTTPETVGEDGLVTCTTGWTGVRTRNALIWWWAPTGCGRPYGGWCSVSIGFFCGR